MGKLLEFFNGSKETKFGQATRDEWYNIVLQPSSPLFVPFAHGLFAPYTSLIMAQSSRKLNITGTGTGRSSSYISSLFLRGIMGLRLQVYTATSERPLFLDQHLSSLLAPEGMRRTTTMSAATMSAATISASVKNSSDGPRLGYYCDHRYNIKPNAQC